MFHEVYRNGTEESGVGITWHGEKVTAETFASQVRELVAKR
jgi:hypothetical protein